MTSKPPPSYPKQATLANGEKVSFREATLDWILLKSWSEEPGGMEHLYHLRQLCLGKAISEQARDQLEQDGVCDIDQTTGELSRLQKTVVLSSLQGTGHAITVVNPFPDPHEARMAELLRAKEDLAFKHGYQMLQSFLMSDLEVAGVPSDWTKRSRRSSERKLPARS